MLEYIAAAVMVVMVAIAVATDVRHGKIPNWVTAPGALIGLVLFGLRDGLPGVGMGLLGAAVGFGMFLFSSLLGRVLGGGDIKLLMAIGAIEGPAFLGYTIISMAIAGGVLAVVVALAHRDLLASLKRLGGGLLMRAYAKVPIDISDSKPTTRLPYAIPIALGSLAALYITMVLQAT